MGDQWERVKQLHGNDVFDKLQQASVAVVGLGSGGGTVAQYLAMSGIGKFVLIDPGNIKLQNISRHVLDSRHVGRPKVYGMEELILYRNPQAQIIIEHDDAMNVLDVLKDVDIVLVCVDSEPARHAINMAVRDLGKIAVTAGVYAKGIGGDVFITYPDHGACYSCIASKLVNTSPPPAKVVDYGQMRNDGTLEAEPGLGMDVAMVALRQTKIAMHLLLSQLGVPKAQLPGNVYIMANEEKVISRDAQGQPLVVLQAGEAKWYTLPRLEGCRMCDMPQQPKTSVSVQQLLKKGGRSCSGIANVIFRLRKRRILGRPGIWDQMILSRNLMRLRMFLLLQRRILQA
jgi:molybdopterin/thiamine biosynthesis adenylyltransferase